MKLNALQLTILATVCIIRGRWSFTWNVINCQQVNPTL